MSTRESTLTAAPARWGWRRGSLNDYVAHHHTLWEGTAALLAALYLAVGLMADAGDTISPYILLGLGSLFLVEFFARLYDSRSRALYIRRHWLDFISCIPLIGGLRSLRMVSLLRLGAAARVLALAESEATEHNIDRTSLWYVVPFLLVVWFLAASVYWTFEHGHNPAVHDFGDALYWAFLTASTIGYGTYSQAAQQPETRILSGILIFVGIGMVGFVSSRLTARLLAGATHEHQLHHRMQKLEGQLDEVLDLLRKERD